MILSRCGTLFLMSPLSSASTQMSVAGSSGVHRCARGPVITPFIGIVSAIGTSATARSFSPRAVPDLHVARELEIREQPRERTLRSRDEHVLPVGRRHAGDDAGPAKRRAASGRGVHEARAATTRSTRTAPRRGRSSADPGTSGSVRQVREFSWMFGPAGAAGPPAAQRDRRDKRAQQGRAVGQPAASADDRVQRGVDDARGAR